MPKIQKTPLERVAELMYSYGAEHVVFKLLANNDNSKQQVYFGSDFEVLAMIPHGEMIGEISEKHGTIFKSRLDFSWLSMDLLSPPVPAPGTQLIFYPRYPEVRMSGFIRGCSNAPSTLMRPPNPNERVARIDTPRCLVMGICADDRIIGFLGSWESDYSADAIERINGESANCVASVFYELKKPVRNTREALLSRLREIYYAGPIAASRLDRAGTLLAHSGNNAAGMTLESLFGILPNSKSEPDYLGWELKAHSGGAVTLMTPEPDTGAYLDDLGQFIADYGRCSPLRRDFTGKHSTGVECVTSKLTLRMEGFNPHSMEIVDPNGGLVLRDRNEKIVAGWTFNKIVTHWSRKHKQTAYVSYKKTGDGADVFFKFGPEVLLCRGNGLKKFLSALHNGALYYDPGVNQKLIAGLWKSKKRNQFRVAWKNVGSLYEESEYITLG